MHGNQMLNESKLQNIPKVGGIKNAIVLCIIIGQQEVWIIGNCSRAQSSPPNMLSLITKFKKSQTRRVVLGNL